MRFMLRHQFICMLNKQSRRLKRVNMCCEKPMALDVAECDRMIAACRANEVRLGVAYYRHFYPVVRRVKELIGSGELGVPIVAQINAFEWFEAKASDAFMVNQEGVCGWWSNIRLRLSSH